MTAIMTPINLIPTLNLTMLSLQYATTKSMYFMPTHHVNRQEQTTIWTTTTTAIATTMTHPMKLTTPPLSRLRRNRRPSYRHLKGRDGDGSLPTVARPHKFKVSKHQAHVILQSIIFTQYNLKQGIKKFGDDGKAAVLVELQQLYDRKRAPVSNVSQRETMWNYQRPWLR